MNKTGIKLSLLVISIFVLLTNVNTAYSRYVSKVSSSSQFEVGKWKILVNNNDVTYNYSSSLTFTPVIDSNSNVRTGKLAPTSTGHFDILLDATAVTTSYSYTITAAPSSTSEISNLVVTDYAIIPNLSGDNYYDTFVDKISIPSGNTFTNTNLFNSNYPYKKIIVRIYFEWEDGQNNSTDDSDTVIGQKAANGQNINFGIDVNIVFSQVAGTTDGTFYSNLSNGSIENIILHQSVPETVPLFSSSIEARVWAYTRYGSGNVTPFYLIHTLDNGVVSGSDMGFVVDDSMVSLCSGMVAGTYVLNPPYDSSSIQSNNSVISSAFGANSSCSGFSYSNSTSGGITKVCLNLSSKNTCCLDSQGKAWCSTP